MFPFRTAVGCSAERILMEASAGTTGPAKHEGGLCDWVSQRQFCPWRFFSFQPSAEFPAMITRAIFSRGQRHWGQQSVQVRDAGPPRKYQPACELGIYSLPLLLNEDMEGHGYKCKELSGKGNEKFITNHSHLDSFMGTKGRQRFQDK